MMQRTPLMDGFGRRIDYLRLSVTDRCNFRCVYCMNADASFLRRAQILSLEELAQVGRSFVKLGVKRIRLTGGEPLMRSNLLMLVQELGELKHQGLQELTMTTNGSQLQRLARPLRQAGLDRLNISLDTLNPNRFTALTRRGTLTDVLAGIDEARAAGFERIRLNLVVMKGRNWDEVEDIVRYALERELDLCFIEEMPIGALKHRQLAETYVSNEVVLQRLREGFGLLATTTTTGGPARYFHIPGQASRVGFISPHSHRFCASCNRVRVSVDGRLFLCLGSEASVDLKQIIRQNPGDHACLEAALSKALRWKPEGHNFSLNQAPRTGRLMNMTGG
jgi:cyclic pyranopterin phosphate synthase